VGVDERLRHALERTARPADPSGIYEHLIRRRERRRLVRRIGSGSLAVIVLVGSVAGFYALTRVFRGVEDSQVATPPVSNGEIVFSIPLEGEGEALMSVRPDGTGLRRLTPAGMADYRSPDISPDGRTVVVTYSEPSFDDDLGVLATVPIEGGSPSLLSKEPGVVVDPVWSPDGRHIAFAGSPGGPYGIYVLELETGEADLVPGTDEINVGGDPTWSPDGSRLAFGVWEGDQVPERWDIYSSRIDGSDLTNLTGTPDESEASPAWSWAEDRIAFVRGVPRGSGIYTMAPDGSDRRLVFDGLPNVGSPAWSPDGTRLAFSADTGQVYTASADGDDLQPVTGALGEPAWQTVTDDTTIGPEPTSSPTPTTTPSPGTGRDIGVGFPVCNVSSIEARFVSPDADSRVFVGTRRRDTGGCPLPQEAFNVVALDEDADGVVESSFGPIECEFECRTFSAPDIDGDGTAELLVVQGGGVVVNAYLYDVVATGGETAIVPVNVAEPGDPKGGFEAGEQASFFVGGDAFELYGLQCGDVPGPDGPGVVATSAESLPHDSPDAEWHAHQTRLVLRDDGLLHVVDVRDFVEPISDGPQGPSFLSGETLCGSNLGP
jgi:Tol biopolymer transport system component